jgi:hypothetical protein
MMSDETQGIANAREARDLVVAAALQLALRAVVHVTEHASVSQVRLDEEMDGGGYVWALSAYYGAGHTFVRVDGEPRRQGGSGSVTTFASIEELAAVMGGQQAAFSCNVPRSWVELAAERAAEMP